MHSLTRSTRNTGSQSPLPLQSELHLAMYYISRHKKQQSKIPPSLLLLSSISNGCWLLAFISCLLCYVTLSFSKPFGYNACPNSIFRSRLSSRKRVDDDDGVKQFESNYKSNLGDAIEQQWSQSSILPNFPITIQKQSTVFPAIIFFFSQICPQKSHNIQRT